VAPANEYQGLRRFERCYGDERPYGSTTAYALTPTPFRGDPADEFEAAAALLVMSGMMVDDRARPPLIVNFESDATAQTAEVSLNPARAVNHGVGNHLAEG
jgi:hypothetical protein